VPKVAGLVRTRRLSYELNAGLWIVNWIAKAVPASAAAISRLQATLAPSGKRVDRPYRIPREIKAWIERSHVPISFPIEYRYVAGDDSFGAPTTGRKSAMIDLEQFKDMPHREDFMAGEEIFRLYDGRPHWGKFHSRSADEFRRLYPEWDRFQDVRRRWDPDGIFTNDYLGPALEPPDR
jgi:FAD/FMN-containing dehydrogenase